MNSASFPPDGKNNRGSLQVRRRIDLPSSPFPIRPSPAKFQPHNLHCICRKTSPPSGCPVSSPNQVEGFVGWRRNYDRRACCRCMAVTIDLPPPAPVVTLSRVGDAAIPQITLACSHGCVLILQDRPILQPLPFSARVRFTASRYGGVGLSALILQPGFLDASRQRSTKREEGSLYLHNPQGQR